ncbi:MAG: cation diffusion facilitator family transporter [Desulfomonilaceae bacterium]
MFPLIFSAPISGSQKNQPNVAFPKYEHEDYKSNFKIMLAAVLFGAVIMGLKFYGYWITGSSAILSDALESIINVVASAFGLGSVMVSARPADENHPYGHGKIEFFSAGFEGSLILVAAIGIFVEGLKQIVNPVDLPNLGEGLFFLVIAGIGNLVLGIALLRVGKQTRSLVLEADGKHLLADVYTSAIVLIGLVLVYWIGWFQLDGIIACAAGINIVFWGTGLVRKAFGGLMHTTDPKLLDEISRLLQSHKKENWISIHRLRAWGSGKRVNVDFHLVVPTNLSVKEAHREVKELEAIFSKHFSGMSDVLIHLDPCAKVDCSFCQNDPCKDRQGTFIHHQMWNRQALTHDVDNDG